MLVCQEIVSEYGKSNWLGFLPLSPLYSWMVLLLVGIVVLEVRETLVEKKLRRNSVSLSVWMQKL